jgi:hypothetical protein
MKRGKKKKEEEVKMDDHSLKGKWRKRIDANQAMLKIAK